MKPGAPFLQPTRLLDQVLVRVQYLHYGQKTEAEYHYCIRTCGIFNRQGDGHRVKPGVTDTKKRPAGRFFVGHAL
jgi:hypothetical protein